MRSFNLDQLAPYFPRLRFYPIPLEQPRRFGSHVHLQDVGTTLADLRRIKPNKRLLAQKEAVEVWLSLYDSSRLALRPGAMKPPPHPHSSIRASSAISLSTRSRNVYNLRS